MKWANNLKTAQTLKVKKSPETPQQLPKVEVDSPYTESFTPEMFQKLLDEDNRRAPIDNQICGASAQCDFALLPLIVDCCE